VLKVTTESVGTLDDAFVLYSGTCNLVTEIHCEDVNPSGPGETETHI